MKNIIRFFKELFCFHNYKQRGGKVMHKTRDNVVLLSTILITEVCSKCGKNRHKSENTR